LIIKKLKLHSRETSVEDKIIAESNITQWKRSEVLKDYRFYIISLNMLAMPWIITGIFVYQSFITDSKMWDAYTIPKAFMVYSISSIITLFLSGFLVDKFTSRKLIPIMNIPLLLAMAVLFHYQNEICCRLYLFRIRLLDNPATLKTCEPSLLQWFYHKRVLAGYEIRDA
jgi:sugar phosphate permease